jgi:guanylate kinase
MVSENAPGGLVVAADGSRAWQPRPLIIIVSGPSGAGKDAVVQGLLARNDSLHFVVTATTRQPRAGEKDGVDYHFLGREEFERRLAAGEFLENALVYGEHRGVLRRELTDALASGRDVIMRVNVDGARAMRRLLPDAVFVFLIAESAEVLLRRMDRRGSESEQSLAGRQAELARELACLPEFDYAIVNRRDALDEAVCHLQAIITAEKLRVRQPIQRVGQSAPS